MFYVYCDWSLSGDENAPKRRETIFYCFGNAILQSLAEILYQKRVVLSQIRIPPKAYFISFPVFVIYSLS